MGSTPSTTPPSSSGWSSPWSWPPSPISSWSSSSDWPFRGRARHDGSGRRPDMHFIDSVFHWFTTAANWTGPNGILQLFYNQAKLSFAVVVGALIIGGGLGVVLGHTGRGGLVAVNAANAFRAVPTLALLTLLAIQPKISLQWDGFLASWIAL